MGLRHSAQAACLAAPIAAIALFALTAAAGAADYTPQEQALIAAAKKEGAVTVLNPQFSDHTGRLLGEGFIKRYNLGPDFKFNNLRKGTGATVAQTRQEIQAGKHTVDMLIVSAPGFFDAAAKRGDFLKLDSGYWKYHEEAARAAGQYFNYPYVVVPFAYTFQPVWNSSCPGMEHFTANSYADVLKPELKGKTIASDLTKSFTYDNTALSLQEEAGINLNDLWTKLKATDPLVEFRTEPKMQMVISCQRPLDMWNLTGRIYQNVLQKPDLLKIIKWSTYKEGQVMLGNQAAVIKGAPHPNAAKLFMEYMLSKEGADIMVVGEMMYTFLKDYTPPPEAQRYVFDMKKTKMIGLKDWVGAQKKFKALREAWQAKFQ
ncbi:MAG TPA: ABC transporter substrate-binding protein [Pseudolabrys sp.]|nr:ABC transporter substrate-binding protein [Pseudolabrys sp.]